MFRIPFLENLNAMVAGLFPSRLRHGGDAQARGCLNLFIVQSLCSPLPPLSLAFATVPSTSTEWLW